MTEAQYDPETGEIIQAPVRMVPPGQPLPAVVWQPDPMINVPMEVEDFERQERLMQAVVDSMKDGVHYGIIPGTGDKRTLYEAGAEKLRRAFRLAWDYVITHEVEDFVTHQYIYRVQAFIHNGMPEPNRVIVARWEASASSNERRFNSMEKDMLNHNVRDRAIKRAFVALIRNATGASGEFASAYDDGAPGQPVQESETSNPIATCPRHAMRWYKDNYDNLYHLDAKGGRCQFRSVMTDRMTTLRNQIEWSTKDVNDRLKERHGATMSKLTPVDFARAVVEFEEFVLAKKAEIREQAKAEGPKTARGFFETPATADATAPETNETPEGTPEPQTDPLASAWPADGFGDVGQFFQFCVDQRAGIGPADLLEIADGIESIPELERPIDIFAHINDPDLREAIDAEAYKRVS